MINTKTSQDNSVSEFVSRILGQVKAKKPVWTSWSGTVNGKKITMKFWGYWLQTYTVDGENFATGQYLETHCFRAVLLEPFRA